MYSGSGNDSFYLYYEGASITIKDFDKANDKINIPNINNLNAKINISGDSNAGIIKFDGQNVAKVEGVSKTELEVDMGKYMTNNDDPTLKYFIKSQ